MQAVSNEENENENEEEEEEMILSKRKKKNGKFSLLETLNEISDNQEYSVDEEEFEEIDLEEMSVAGSISGPALPLGKSTKQKSDGKHIRMSEQEKIVKEQIERMRMLEAYHQKTTNKLK